MAPSHTANCGRGGWGGGFWLVPPGEQQCPLGLMSPYWSQQPLLSKMNYRSPHGSESVICAQPAGQGGLLVAVVMDVNFHCRLLAPNSPGFTTQNSAVKKFHPEVVNFMQTPPQIPISSHRLFYYFNFCSRIQGSLIMAVRREATQWNVSVPQVIFAINTLILEINMGYILKKIKATSATTIICDDMTSCG